MNISSIKRALLAMMMIFGFISVLSYYRHISYSTEKATGDNRNTQQEITELNNVLTFLEINDNKKQQIESKNDGFVHGTPNKNGQTDRNLISVNDDNSKVVNGIAEQVTNKNNEVVQGAPNKSEHEDQKLISGNGASKIVNGNVAPLDDFEKYPCVPGIPHFPTSSWTATGKCVRVFNDTDRANKLNKKCVSLRTSKNTTSICIYDSVEDHFISAALQRSGQWEGGMVDSILNMLNKHPNAEFLDLGCNIGTYSLAAAAFGHHIIAVDAVIDNLELLSKSLTLGKLQDKAILIWNAISDEYSKVALTKYKGNVGGTAIRDLTTEDKKNKETFITQTIKLDDLVPLMKGKTVVIKMDIETKEYSALLGGTNFFDSVDIPMIQMEINWHRTRESGPKIVDYLAQRNFAVFADPGKLRPLNVSNIQTWPGDVYFLKP